MKSPLKSVKFSEISIFLVFLPYFFVNLSNLINSPYADLFSITGLVVCFMLLDLFARWGLQKINIRYKAAATLTIFLFFCIFFYGYQLTNSLQNVLADNNILIRGRTVFLGILFFTLLFILIIRHFRVGYSAINLFFIFWSFLVMSQAFYGFNKRDPSIIDDKYVNIDSPSFGSKQVVLIISDEYASPHQLYGFFGDSTIYNFSNNLSSRGWYVKDSFKTFEISTVHSLSSLFNFNLSQNSEYGKLSKLQLTKGEPLNSCFYDSLRLRGVSILNYGILDIGLSSSFSPLYFFPTSFLEVFFQNSLYFVVRDNTYNLSLRGLGLNYFTMEEHNHFIFDSLPKILNNQQASKFFSYVHLYMPHFPMQYLPEFPHRKEQNIQNYFAYWKFTNLKLTDLLSRLTKENKYRVILTGDHGYRGDKRINPYQTFAAFYGFDSTSLRGIKSVQDLGSLIVQSY